MSPLDLLILCLATWRLAYFVTKEGGPFSLAARLREKTTLGGLLTCVKCASMWTALLMLVLWQTPLVPLVWVFAISGGALMLESYTGAGHT
jgi:hypothetical protein